MSSSGTLSEDFDRHRTAGADVAGITAVWVAAEDHAFHIPADAGAMAGRNLIFEAQVADP